MNAQNHTRHLFGSILCAVSFLIATGTTAFAQASGQERPYRSEQVVINTEWIIRGFVWLSESSGKATHLGKTSGSAFNRVYGGVFNPETGKWIIDIETKSVEVAANGDELYMTTLSTLDLADPEEIIYGSWVITGGTGRFENATGSGVSVGRPNAEGNRVFISEGEINY